MSDDYPFAECSDCGHYGIVTPLIPKPGSAKSAWRTPMSKISLTDEYGTYTVDCFDKLSTLPDMFERLVIPVLMASGFSRELINAYMDNKLEQ